MSIVYELEKKSSLVTRAFSAKSCTRDTDSLHSCTRLRLVQEMACLYHECKILPRKHSYPNLIPIGNEFVWNYLCHYAVEQYFLHVQLQARENVPWEIPSARTLSFSLVIVAREGKRC